MKKRSSRFIIIGVVLLFIVACAAVDFTGITDWQQVYRILGVSDFADRTQYFPFRIHFIDVKKADAILIQCEGYNILIDGGTPDYSDMLTEYLTRQGVAELDMVIATHPDRDHIGGLAGVLQEIPTRTVLFPEFPEDEELESPEYLQFIAAVNTTGAILKHPESGEEYYFGDMYIHILAPLHYYNETNNNSIVAKLRYGERQYLFTGDAEEIAENDLLESGLDLQADVLKIAHHGSKSSSSKRFLLAVNPTYAIISTGRDRSKLPNKKVLARLENLDITYLRTDYDGTIILVSDGSDIRFITEKTGGYP